MNSINEFDTTNKIKNKKKDNFESISQNENILIQFVIL